MYCSISTIFKISSTAPVAFGGQGPGRGATATGAGAVDGPLRLPRGAEAAWPWEGEAPRPV